MKALIEFITPISTIVLVTITAYYAIITHRILKYQRDIALLEFRPFLKMDRVIATYVKDANDSPIRGIKIGIKLKNVSRVMLQYNVVKMEVELEGRSNPDSIFLNNGGYVYPDQEVDFSFSVIGIESNIPDVIKGILEYEFDYFASSKKKYKSYRRYALFIYHKSNYMEWKSLEEKETEF